MRGSRHSSRAASQRLALTFPLLTARGLRARTTAPRSSAATMLWRALNRGTLFLLDYRTNPMPPCSGSLPALRIPRLRVSLASKTFSLLPVPASGPQRFNGAEIELALD